MARERRIAFDVIKHGTPQEPEAAVQDEVYRIASEALTNAFQHSSASHIVLEIAHAPEGITVSVRDNGIGIGAASETPSEKSRHFGLQGMRERANRIGADLIIRNHSERGTEVIVNIRRAVASQRDGRWWHRIWAPEGAWLERRPPAN